MEKWSTFHALTKFGSEAFLRERTRRQIITGVMLYDEHVVHKYFFLFFGGAGDALMDLRVRAVESGRGGGEGDCQLR